MLFKFGFFWKSILTILLSWVAWVTIGYELTMITMIALIISIITKDKHYLM